MPDELFRQSAQFAARIRLGVRVAEAAKDVLLARELRLHRGFNAHRQHVLFKQERRNIEAEGCEVAIVASQQPAIQPDIGDQEGAVESQQSPLAMTRPRKTKPVPDRFVANRCSVQTRHLRRCPGIVVVIRSRIAAVLTFPKRRDRHPPAGLQLLTIEGLLREEGKAIVQRHIRRPAPAARHRRS